MRGTRLEPAASASENASSEDVALPADPFDSNFLTSELACFGGLFLEVLRRPVGVHCFLATVDSGGGGRCLQDELLFCFTARASQGMFSDKRPPTEEF